MGALLLVSGALTACGPSAEAPTNAGSSSRLANLLVEAGLTERFRACDALSNIATPGTPADISCKLREINARRGMRQFAELCRALSPGYSRVSEDGRCIYPGI
jgi:hypothetical protein